MKFSMVQEYGIRCVIHLSKKFPQIATVKEIAKCEGISTDYIEKILLKLRKAGITQSIRGVRGGYKLSKKPSKINAIEILRALGEVGFNENNCYKIGETKTDCVHNMRCRIKPFFLKINRLINRVLKETSITEFI